MKIKSIITYLLLVTLPLYLFAGVTNPSNLTSGGNTTASASITTASISPAPNSLVIILVGTNSNPAVTHDSASSGFNVTAAGWTSAVNNTQGFNRTSFWYAITTASPGSGTITVNFSANSNRRSWIVAELQGFHETAPIDETASATGTATTLSVSMADIEPGNIFYSGCSSIAATGITPGTNETEHDEDTSGGANENRSQTQYGTDTTQNWSGLATTANVGLGLEIAKARRVNVTEIKVKELTRGAE